MLGSSTFLKGLVINLLKLHFNHRPLLVKLNNHILLDKNKCPFRLQVAWMSHESFNHLMNNVWSSSTFIKGFLVTFSEKLKSGINRHLVMCLEREKKKKTLLARINSIQKILQQRHSSLANLETEL